MKADVVVIGAGVLGISVAYHLGCRGQRVVVLEREPSFAQHASGKNAGMFRQLYRHEALTDWAMRSRLGWPAAVREVAFRETGSLIVGREVPGHHDELFVQEEHRLPNAQATLGAVFTPTDGLIEPGDYTRSMFQLSRAAGVEYLFRAQVKALTQAGEGWEVEAQTPEGSRRWEAPWVVNAAGAWVNEFLGALPLAQVDAQAYARHLFLIEGWQEGGVPLGEVGYYWDEYSHWYTRLWDRHARLVSICDRMPARPETFVPAPGIGEEVAQKLLRSLPTLASSLRMGRSWFCFRTYTDDQRPIWGEDPRYRGLFWLAAFGGFGMSTSYAATADAAAVVCGEDVRSSEDFVPTRVQPQVPAGVQP